MSVTRPHLSRPPAAGRPRADDPRDEQPSWAARLQERDEVRAVTTDLVREYSPVVPAGAVIRHVAAARRELLSAGVRAGLAHAIHGMVVTRLRDVLHHGHGRTHGAAENTQSGEAWSPVDRAK